MTKFIALRREPRTTFLGLEARPMVDKRMRIAQDAPESRRSEVLREIGLARVEPDEQLPKDVNKFQRLGYAGAYVVDTANDVMAAKAREVLTPDYHIMPDIEMGLPKAILSQRFVRRPRRKSYWPAESGVAEAHRQGITGKGVLVGVLDTGVDADHLEFRDRRLPFRYVPLQPTEGQIRSVRGFDTNGHGTHVAGIIGGRNVGVAPDVELLVAAVIESETVKTSLERVMVALDWMLSHFQLPENADKPFILNLSLGFRPEWIGVTEIQSVVEGMHLLLRTLVMDFDVLPVAAIGNDGPGVVRAPGYFPECLSVGAVGPDLRPPWFSGSGLSPVTQETEPDIAGYGVAVLSALERDLDRVSIYAEKSGTSMAAPYVTGIAALTASANPGLQGEALRRRILDNALRLEEGGSRVGAGLARFI
ncbi:MAG: S8 family serine peptidase [Anaerolineae bacterium]|jgi:subtilisin family serine protease|nr:S8 family serine peptidase [Anaerolineae bacterium]MDX9828849.1 S8 family serine peptidase [Anaerolineae bacterium]